MYLRSLYLNLKRMLFLSLLLGTTMLVKWSGTLMHYRKEVTQNGGHLQYFNGVIYGPFEWQMFLHDNWPTNNSKNNIGWFKILSCATSLTECFAFA